jgi:hypothetical protein
MRALLTKGEPEVLPFKLLVLQFSIHLPSLIKDTLSVNPDLVVLGNGFGYLPFVGEKFVCKLTQAGFTGRVAVCCRDTYKVLPCATVVRLSQEDGQIRQALVELMS